MGQMSTKYQLLAVTLLAAAFAALSVTVAGAANVKNGVRMLSPKDGAVVPTTGASGKAPTFKIRVRGRGVVFFHVCKRKTRDATGRLCGRRPSEDIDRGKKGPRSKRGRIYTFTPDAFTFPGYYLNTPGTYYWQAYKIDCKRGPGPLDCAREGPIRKFVVR